MFIGRVTSSILIIVQRHFFRLVAVLGLLCLSMPGRAFADDEKAADNFFAGTVKERTSVLLTVARVWGISRKVRLSR